MIKGLNVVFLGTCDCYGYGYSATITKVDFMARGLIEQGAIVTIVNSVVGTKVVNKRTILHKDGVGDVISYPKNGNQLISWTKNIADMKKDLKSLFIKNAKNIVVLEAPDYHIYCLYCYYAHKYGYKIAVIAHEWMPTITKVHPLRKPLRKLYSMRFGYNADAILPISEYIINKIGKFNKPYIKVPVLASFEGFPQKQNVNNYFVYCVFANYTRTIFPILEAFAEFKKSDRRGYKFLLVLGGESADIENVKDYILKNKMEESVDVKSKLPYSELVELYNNASGLLIPFDPDSEQDYARFSQKIAEYASSGSPIISCKVGEVDYYFKDKESIVFSDYTKQGFIDSFTWVANHPEEAVEIGRRGYEVGKCHFNYKLVGKQLYDFLLQI